MILICAPVSRRRRMRQGKRARGRLETHGVVARAAVAGKGGSRWSSSSSSSSSSLFFSLLLLPSLRVVRAVAVGGVLRRRRPFCDETIGIGNMFLLHCVDALLSLIRYAAATEVENAARDGRCRRRRRCKTAEATSRDKKIYDGVLAHARSRGAAAHDAPLGKV